MSAARHRWRIGPCWTFTHGYLCQGVAQCLDKLETLPTSLGKSNSNFDHRPTPIATSISLCYDLYHAKSVLQVSILSSRQICLCSRIACATYSGFGLSPTGQARWLDCQEDLIDRSVCESATCAGTTEFRAPAAPFASWWIVGSTVVGHWVSAELMIWNAIHFLTATLFSNSLALNHLRTLLLYVWSIAWMSF